MQKNSIIHYSNLIFTVPAVTHGGYTREKFSSKHLSLSPPPPTARPSPSPPHLILSPCLFSPPLVLSYSLTLLWLAVRSVNVITEDGASSTKPL